MFKFQFKCGRGRQGLGILRWDGGCHGGPVGPCLAETSGKVNSHCNAQTLTSMLISQFTFCMANRIFLKLTILPTPWGKQSKKCQCLIDDTNFKDTELILERQSLLAALACPSNPALLDKYLEKSIDPESKIRYKIHLVCNFCRENCSTRK